MTALEYLNTEWARVDRRLPDMERRAAWERIVEACSRTYGHDATSVAIIAHVNKSAS